MSEFNDAFQRLVSLVVKADGSAAYTSARAWSAIAGVSPGLISQYLKDPRRMRDGVYLYKLLKTSSVPEDVVFSILGGLTSTVAGVYEALKRLEDDVGEVDVEKVLRFGPLPTFEISAGEPIYATDQNYPVGESGEKLTYRELRGGDENAYALKIHGESMEPLLYEGDFVVVAPNKEPSKNHICVFKLAQSEEASCKIYHNLADGRLEFIPKNPAWERLVYEKKEVAWIYPVIWVFRRVS